MYDGSGQRFQAVQAVAIIQIGDHGQRARRPEFRYARPLAGDGNDLKSVAQQGQEPHADIAAANHQ